MSEILQGTLNFYTDGACSGNPGPGGFGVVLLNDDNEIEYAYSKQFDNTTNNRMELQAILHVLEEFHHLADFGFDIIIHSDSAYCVNMMKDWIWKWAANGWTRASGKPIENLDIIKEIYPYLHIKHLQFIKVSGHSGIVGNELADTLATNNITKYKTIIKKNALYDDTITREA